MGWQSAPIIAKPTANSSVKGWESAPLVTQDNIQITTNQDTGRTRVQPFNVGMPTGDMGPMSAGQGTSTVTGGPVTEQEINADNGPAIPEYIGRPLLESGGMVAGGVMAAPGLLTSVAGGSLGYAAGKNAADIIYEKDQPSSIGDALLKTVKDVSSGAKMEMAGPILGKTISAVAKPIGNLTKQLLGATTGAGPGMTEEALKGSPMFKETMRGKITGDKVVDNALDALQSLRDSRASTYQGSLNKISEIKGDIDIAPVKNHLSHLMKRYNVKVGEDGSFDFSRIAMGKSGRNDIEEIVQTIAQWGKKEGDLTPSGLDVLKRQLDDFYSDSSQARGFVQGLKDTVRNTISKAVPEYAQMTKGYGDATKLIKDIEGNLMMKKQGMSGRITPDQTLRRLTSAMRENFELRNDLVKTLGDRSGEDLSGQIAGYTASQLVPKGLVGKMAAGSAGVVTYINPKFWPLLLSSSPRAVGEFLSAYGVGLRAIKATSPATIKAMGYGTGKMLEEDNQ